MLDTCIIHGFGYLGSRITGLIAGTRVVQDDWTPIVDLPFHVGAIVERDPDRRARARASHPSIPCFGDVGQALACVKGSATFIKDFTSPRDRISLLDSAKRLGIPVLLEKPLSSPGLEVSLDGREADASVNMSEVFNPVVRALARKLSYDSAEILSLAFVRVNSLTLQRLRDSRYRRDIIGGAFVDKLIHDLHLLISGTILGPVEPVFEAPQVNEIAFDVVAGDGQAGLSFTSLDGERLSEREIVSAKASPSEMMVDVTIPVKMDGRTVETRWIASWCGVPDDLADRLGISVEDIAAARLVSAPSAGRDGRDAYAHSNLKMIVCRYRNAAGEDIQLVCNIQARGTVKAWLIERCNGDERRLPVRYCVPVIESMIAFSRSFRTGGYLDVRHIQRADRAALEIRSAFRAPLDHELRVDRSLALLDRYHGRPHPSRGRPGAATLPD